MKISKVTHYAALKQTLIRAIAKNVTVSVPHMANGMPIHITALYPIIIQFNEETIQLM